MTIFPYGHLAGRGHSRHVRGLALMALAVLACSDTPTGMRAIQFASSLGVDLATFVETPSGLFYRDNEAGEGTVAASGSFVNFFIQGWRSDGSEIQPRAEFTNLRLGTGQLIPGVDEALQGMQPGGDRTAVVPPQLGYGQGIVLVFRIELSSVR